MLVVAVAGLILMAVGYILLGPLPQLQQFFGLGHAPWLVWVSLGSAGAGAGWAFVPLLPAMLNGLAEVWILLTAPCLGYCCKEAHLCY